MGMFDNLGEDYFRSLGKAEKSHGSTWESQLRAIDMQRWQEMKVHEMQMKQAMMAQGLVHGHAQTAANNLGHSHSVLGSMHATQAASQPTEDPNDAVKYPAMAASLSVLRDLWAAKWCERWASSSEIVSDPFWSEAHPRMIRQKMLETMNMRDGGIWYRLLES